MASPKGAAERQTALVTGASSGIGLEMAREFAAGGHDLVLVARSGRKLEDLATELRSRHGADARVVASDLARPESPEEIFAELQGAGVAVDVLVNNAGFATFGPFAETDLGRELEELQVNVVALTHLTKKFLPGMLGRRRGGVLNVASTAAFQPGPLMAVSVARAGYEGFRAGKRIVIPGLLNKMGAQSIRLTPRSLATRVVKRMQARRH